MALAYEWATDVFGHVSEPGTSFSFGWAGLRDSRAEPAVVDDITLGEGDVIVLVEGHAVLQNDDPNAITDIPGFPPPGWEDLPLTPRLALLYRRSTERPTASPTSCCCST